MASKEVNLLQSSLKNILHDNFELFVIDQPKKKELIIICDLFAGKSHQKRHEMIENSLPPEIPFTLLLFTKKEWDTEKLLDH